MAGDHGCRVRSRAIVVEPSQQGPEQVKAGLLSGACAATSSPTAVLGEIQRRWSQTHRCSLLPCSDSLQLTHSPPTVPPPLLCLCLNLCLLHTFSEPQQPPPPLLSSTHARLMHTHAGHSSLHEQPHGFLRWRWRETLQIN